MDVEIVPAVIWNHGIHQGHVCAKAHEAVCQITTNESEPSGHQSPESRKIPLIHWNHASSFASENFPVCWGSFVVDTMCSEIALEDEDISPEGGLG